MINMFRSQSFLFLMVTIFALYGCEDSNKDGSGGTGMTPAGEGGAGGDGNQMDPGEGGSGGEGNQVVEPGEGGSGGDNLGNVNASIQIHARRFNNLSSVFHQNSGLRNTNLTVGKLYMMVCTVETGNGEDCYRDGIPYFIADLPLPGINSFRSGDDLIQAENIPLPEGEYEVYFVIDSQLSQDKESAFFLEDGSVQDGGARNMDVVSLGLFSGDQDDIARIPSTANGGEGHPNTGEEYFPNPPGTENDMQSIRVSFAENEVTVVGSESRKEGVNLIGEPLMFGHIVIDPVTPAPAPGIGKFLISGKQPDGFVNGIHIIDESNYSLTDDFPVIAQIDGQPYSGDLCGMIQGSEDLVYVLGSRPNGNERNQGHIFVFNTQNSAFENEAIEIPTNGPVGAREFNLCNGTYLEKNNRRYLALVSDGDLIRNDLDSTYGLVIIDVTDFANPRVSEFKFDSPLFNGQPNNNLYKIKSVTSFGDKLYLASLNWNAGNRNNQTEVQLFSLLIDDPNPALENPINLLFANQPFDAGVMVACDGPQSPGLFVHEFDNAPYLLVGSSVPAEFRNIGGDEVTGIRAYPINPETGVIDELGLMTVDTSLYGRAIVQLAPSPNRDELFAVHACEAFDLDFYLEGEDDQNVQKQTIAVLSLEDPLFTFNYTERDLDGDPRNNRHENLADDEDAPDPATVHDGGVDMTALSLLRYTKFWCEGRCGLDPIFVQRPQIAVGDQSLMLRVGPTANLDGLSVAAMGDILPINRATGQIAIVREDFDPFTTGGNGYFGFDLSPNIPNEDDDRHITVPTSVIWVP